MNPEKNYIVELQLHEFFQDHRASCLSFINTSMRTIHDFKMHIGKIFNIRDFYLKKVGDKQDHFLPDVEDVRIIKPEDAIFVVPHVRRVQDTIPCSSVAQNVEEALDDFIAPVTKTKKKKKRKISEVITEVANDNVQGSKKKKSNDFEPIAHSSVKSRKPRITPIQSAIVEKNITYFENLSNSTNSSESITNMELDNEQVQVQNQGAMNIQSKEFKEKLENIIGDQDFSTPLSSTQNQPKKLKKKKSQLTLESKSGTTLAPDTVGTNEDVKAPKAKKTEAATKRNDESEILNENSKTPLRLSPTPKHIKDKSQLEKKEKLQKVQMSTSSNEKLIRNITPARNILPSGVLTKNINIIHNIVTRLPNLSNSIVVVDKTNSLHETMECKSQVVNETKRNNDLIVPNQVLEVAVPTSEPMNTEEHEVVSESTAKLNDVPITQDQPEIANLISKTHNITKSFSEMFPSFIRHSDNDNSFVPQSSTMESGIHSKEVETKSFTAQSPHVLANVETKLIDISSPSPSLGTLETNLVTRRKRSRKRTKKLVDHVDSPMPSPIVSTFTGRKLNVPAKPLIHLRFDNEAIAEMPETSCLGNQKDVNVPEMSTEVNGQINKVNEMKPDVIAVANGVNGDSHARVTDMIDTPHIHSNINQKRMMKSNHNNHDHNELSILGKYTTKEAIANCRLVDKLEHIRNKDLILFQKLKLGPAFNPEVSENIVARIENINVETQDLHLSILEGISEFELPYGVLSMSVEDDYNSADILQVLQWNELIKPQLLSP